MSQHLGRPAVPPLLGYTGGVRLPALLLLLALTACSGSGAGPGASAPGPEATAPCAPAAPPATPEQDPGAVPRPSAVPAVITVPYRVEVRTADAATRGAAAVVEETLSDPRGWVRAGFRLVRDDAPTTPFSIVLAEGDEVDRLCLPYETYGRYSCQNGPVVALNADRWRTATPEWTGDLATYRQMLVNHEVGHLLGLHHPPRPQCPVPGRPALVMSQQSTELNGCLPNPWPLEEEVELAARQDEPLAPPYERDVSP